VLDAWYEGGSVLTLDASGFARHAIPFA
jgi:hypothetical protein